MKYQVGQSITLELFGQSITLDLYAYRKNLGVKMKRDYYQDIGYKPFLFYLVFGVSAEELEVSQKRHKVGELPEGLDIRSFTREALWGSWIRRRSRCTRRRSGLSDFLARK